MNRSFSFGGSGTASSTYYIVLGLILLIFPGMSGTAFCWGLAAFAIIMATPRLKEYNSARKAGLSASSDGAVGFLFLIIGLVCLFSPATVLSILPLALGIILLLSGITKIAPTMEAYRSGDSAFRRLLISTLIPLILGLVLISNPFGAAKSVIRFFGLSLLINGACDMSAGSAKRR